MHNRLMNNITAVLVIYCLAASFFIFGKSEDATPAAKSANGCCTEMPRLQSAPETGSENTTGLLAVVSTR